MAQYEDKLIALPKMVDIEEASRLSDIHNEVTLRGGNITIPSTSDPAQGIEAGVIRLTKRIDRKGTFVETLVIGGVTFTQVNTYAEVVAGTYFIHRPSNKVYFHTTDYGKAVTELTYKGSGDNFSKDYVGRTNEAVAQVGNTLASVADAVELLGVNATVMLKLKVADLATLTTNFPAAQHAGQEAWVTAEGLTYESDGTAWDVRTGGTQVVTATMTQPMVSEGVTPEVTIAIQFSEAVDPATVTHSGTGTGSFELRNDGTLAFIAGALSTVDNITWYLDPTNNLAHSTNFSVRLADTIKSADGLKAYNGQNFSFATMAPVTASSPSPTNGATEQYTFVGQGTNLHSSGVGNDISVLLDADVDPATVTATGASPTVICSDDNFATTLPGTASYSNAGGVYRISFVPTNNFGFNKTITMKLVGGASGIKGTGGQELSVAEYTWAFSTYATPLTDPAWTVDYPCDVDPTLATPVWTKETETGGNTATSNGTLLTIAKNGSTSGRMAIRRLWGSDPATGATIDAKITEASGARQMVEGWNGGYRGRVEIRPADKQLRILEGVGVKSFVLDTTKANREYRLTVKREGSAIRQKVFVDRNPVPVLNELSTVLETPNYIYVGAFDLDNSVSMFKYDFIKYWIGGVQET